MLDTIEQLMIVMPVKVKALKRVTLFKFVDIID